MSWTELTESLSSVSCTTAGTFIPGTVLDLDQIMTEHAMQITGNQLVTGQTLVYLHGSFDGVNWWNLVTSGQPAYLSPASSTGPFAGGVLITGPARYVRAGVDSTVSGSPAVTVSTLNASTA